MEDQNFKNAKDALKYVQDQGWKIKKSAFYKHIKEGKLHRADDGFNMKAVERYAKTFLNRTDGAGKTKSEKIISLSERKLRAEALKLESQARHWELKALATTGEYVSKKEVEQDMVNRALIFKTEINNFILTQSTELIRLCNGDFSKVDDCIRFFLDAAANWLDDYTRTEWQVIFDEIPGKSDWFAAKVIPYRMKNDEKDENGEDYL